MKKEEIKLIRLYNFRTYSNLEFFPDPCRNLVKGPNQTGKSNLLEAIYYLSCLRSYRMSGWKQLVRRDTEGFRIELVKRSDGRDEKIKIIRPIEGHMNIFLGDKKLSVRSELLGKFQSVVFHGRDIDLVRGPPAGRRAWMDMIFSRTDGIYLEELKKYRRLLQQRNQILHGARLKNSMGRDWDEWDGAYRKQALLLTEKRKRKTMELLKSIQGFYEALSPEERMVAQYWSQLESTSPPPLEKEIGRGQTLFGPHLDDLRFLLQGGASFRLHGSEGQNRALAFALRFAEKELIEKDRGVKPVLLFDDSFLELDSQKKVSVFERFSGDYQTIVTGTDDGVFAGKNFKVKVWVHYGGDKIHESGEEKNKD